MLISRDIKINYKKMLRKKNNDRHIFLKSNFKSKILKVKSKNVKRGMQFIITEYGNVIGW